MTYRSFSYKRHRFPPQIMADAGIVTSSRACGPNSSPVAKVMKKISYSGYRFPA